jgi:hypothetical protein
MVRRELLFIFKARKQAHSELCGYFCNVEDEQKDKSVVEIIPCTFLTFYFVQSPSEKYVFTSVNSALSPYS